ncbi:MAG: YadA-like family protein, partial [Neisseriaceae bacterium]|nr:YadA-like family protein [Neisseriaceae bacterium]
AMGFSTDATGERSFALGTGSTELNEPHKGARAGGQGSIVIGDRAIASSKTGDVQTDTNVNDSVAIGTGSHVKSRNSVAMGGGISYTYYTGGDAKTSYYDNGWKKDAESTGATVGEGADGAIALGGASADVTDGGNDYYPSTIATVDVDSYVKAAQVADGAKRAIAMGSGSQVGGEIDLSSTTIYESSYKSEVNGDPAKDITGKQGVAADKKGADSVALGPKNAVLEDASTAVGQENLVLTKNSGALGYKSVVAAKTSYSLGNGNILGNNSAGEIENVFAFGNNITKTASRSVFLGDYAAYVKTQAQYDTSNKITEDKGSTAGKQTYATNAEDIYFIDAGGNPAGLAIEANSLKFAGATPVGVVSVGDVGSERRIQNVAAGLISEESTDAINGSQLYYVVQKLKPSGGTTIINNDVSINAGNNIQVTKNGPNNYTIATTRDINVEGDLNVEGNTTVNNFAINPNSNVDIGGNQIHNVAAGTADTDAVNVGQLRQAIDDVNNHINAVSKQADAAAAAAIAVASMPQSYLPGKNLIAIGGGTYNGQTGYAIGLSTISDNGAWIFKATATGNSKKRFGAGVGAGFLW